jgi:excisionase family DNA binding protein
LLPFGAEQTRGSTNHVETTQDGGHQVRRDHYDVSPQTVRRWIASGKITAHRIGPRLIRVDLDEIEAKIIHTVPTVNGQS